MIAMTKDLLAGEILAIEASMLKTRS